MANMNQPNKGITQNQGQQSQRRDEEGKFKEQGTKDNSSSGSRSSSSSNNR